MEIYEIGPWLAFKKIALRLDWVMSEVELPVYWLKTMDKIEQSKAPLWTMMKDAIQGESIQGVPKDKGATIKEAAAFPKSRRSLCLQWRDDYEKRKGGNKPVLRLESGESAWKKSKQPPREYASSQSRDEAPKYSSSQRREYASSDGTLEIAAGFSGVFYRQLREHAPRLHDRLDVKRDSWQNRQALNVFVWFHTHGEARRRKGRSETIECLLCKDEMEQGHRRSMSQHSKLHESHRNASKKVTLRLTREDLDGINKIRRKLGLRAMDTNPAYWTRSQPASAQHQKNFPPRRGDYQPRQAPREQRGRGPKREEAPRRQAEFKKRAPEEPRGRDGRDRERSDNGEHRRRPTYNGGRYAKQGARASEWQQVSRRGSRRSRSVSRGPRNDQEPKYTITEKIGGRRVEREPRAPERGRRREPQQNSWTEHAPRSQVHYTAERSREESEPTRTREAQPPQRVEFPPARRDPPPTDRFSRMTKDELETFVRSTQPVAPPSFMHPSRNAQTGPPKQHTVSFTELKTKEGSEENKKFLREVKKSWKGEGLLLQKNTSEEAWNWRIRKSKRDAQGVQKREEGSLTGRSHAVINTVFLMRMAAPQIRQPITSANARDHQPYEPVSF
jgi:hypothetical protein